ncbi:DUF4833 domain-containing protein [Pedobacter nyackensis]|uniref:DUF4833 domain-containing protein n=1 Tax=Pedobacter nyackensis TaxID=475255 RepID=UPI002931787D|nr:DUF4833 domain-containing protein [Pedobacter nyackensis]
MIFVLSQLSYAQNQIEISTQSTANNNNDFLFFLQRSPETNKVGYALNYKESGKLCENEPIKAFWISENNHQKLKPLTTKEERQAYGLKTKSIGNNEFEIRLIAYNKIPLYLKKSEIGDNYRIYIQDEDKALLLKRIFIKLNHGTFWFPKLQYIDLTTTTLNSETKL